MRKWKRAAAAALVVVVIAALAVTLRTMRGADAHGKAAVRPLYPTAAPSFGCGRWAVVQSPNVPLDSTTLNGVTALSTDDVWAVGGTEGGPTVAEHWDGTSWTIIASPDISNMQNTLTGIAAVSSTDIWAVGQTNPLGGGISSTLTEHWNGTSWTIVPSPNVGTAGSALLAVAAVSADDVWAVGSLGFGSGGTLIEHWNGTSWSVVSSPAGDELLGISAVSATDIWAVGTLSTDIGSPLTVHWDGTSWTSVANAPLNAISSGATAVVARASNDVWFAGFDQTVSGPNLATLIEHWNGTAWSVVASPNSAQQHNFLRSMTAVPGSNQLWAVGTAMSVTGSSVSMPLIEHWNGAHWSLFNSPTLGPDGGLLTGVSAVSASDVWSVGANALESLTEHFTRSRTLVYCPVG